LNKPYFLDRTLRFHNPVSVICFGRKQRFNHPKKSKSNKQGTLLKHSLFIIGLSSFIVNCTIKMCQNFLSVTKKRQNKLIDRLINVCSSKVNSDSAIHILEVIWQFNNIFFKFLLGLYTLIITFGITILCMTLWFNYDITA
jgi:cytochrome c biogenesis protein CcdA